MEEFVYYRLPRRTRLSLVLEQIKNIFSFPGKVIKWWKWYVRVSGFAPWLNLGKFLLIFIYFIMGVATVINYIIMNADYTRISWGSIIGVWILTIICSLIFFTLSWFVIYFGWKKWGDHSGRLDELWKQTGEELGLNLTMTRFSRRLTGIYKGVPLLITDRYTRTGLPFLSRRLSIAGCMAGVTIKSLDGRKIDVSEKIKFSTLILRKELWPEKFNHIREPLKQTIRNIIFYKCIPSENYQFIISDKAFTFAHNAYSPDPGEDYYDILSMPLRLLIEAYVMAFKCPELLNGRAVDS